MYRQYALMTEDSVLVCWLKTDARLTVGTEITLKQIPDVRWRIAHVYSTELTDAPNTRWEVGGL